MSIRLRDLVRAVRSCKTAAQEREVIAKESAELRTAFREQDTIFRHRNVAKLMFMHMLGYPTHFGQMEAVKLVAAPGFAAKRVGYLALAVLVDERQEVLMLVTNSVKQDLQSRDQYVAGLALAAVANIASAGMARDLAPDVARLTGAPSAYLRKKAALAAVRVLARVPDLADTFVDAPVALLADRHHGVLLGGAALASAVAALDAAAAAAYAAELPAGVARLLGGLVAAGGSASEHDVGGVCDPWLQVALLRLLRDLAALGGPLAPADAAAVADAVAAVAAAVDGSTPAGAAVLYEAARCALAPPTPGGGGGDAGAPAAAADDGGLRALAVAVLGRFLASRDANLRYVALDSLARLAAGDPAAVQRHRATVVACVRDGDASIRRRALELVCALATPANAGALVKELTDYLAVTDAAFRPELAARLAALAARHARGATENFDALLKIMATPGARLDAAPARRAVVLASNDPAAAAHAAAACWRVLADRSAPEDGPLLATALWFVGEYADDVMAAAGASPSDVAAVLASYADPATAGGADPADRAAALTAVAKLAARAPAAAPAAAAAAAARSTARDVEEQTRAVEYGALLGAGGGGGGLAAAVLDRVPPLDPAAHAAAADALPAPPPGEGGVGDLIGDLLSLDVGGGAGGEGGGGAAAAAPAAAAPVAVDPLADLFGGVPPPAAPGAASTADAGGRGALPADLFAEEAPPAAPAAPPPASAAASPVLHTVTALASRGLSVSLAFTKPDPDPAATTATATVTWTEAAGGAAGVSVQAAVPKFCRLRLDPPSGDAVAAGGPPLTQVLHVTNTAHGVKAVALRLRVAWTTADGESVVETAEVKGLPPSI